MVRKVRIGMKKFSTKSLFKKKVKENSDEVKIRMCERAVKSGVSLKFDVDKQDLQEIIKQFLM